MYFKKIVTKKIKDSQTYIRQNWLKNGRRHKFYYIMIKVSAYQNIIINVYEHNIREPKYIQLKLTDIKGEIKATQ